MDLAKGWVRLEPGERRMAKDASFPSRLSCAQCWKRNASTCEHIERATEQIVLWVSVHSEGSRIKDLRGAWANACKGDGVPGRLVHDFRRTAVRNLERAGVPHSAAMKMTGHKTEAVYRIVGTRL